MTPEEIDNEVMRRYPKNEDERRGCQTAIVVRNQMRKEYREALNSGAPIKQGVVE